MGKARKTRQCRVKKKGVAGVRCYCEEALPVGFAGSCLAIGEEAAVVALKALRQQRQAHRAENDFLIGKV